jgi:hypothetical protein
MTDINVDDFFKDAARTLTALYGVFPRRQAIFVDDVYQMEEPDEFGLHSDRYQACFSTLLWLGEEGYLRFEDTIRGEAIDQAVLTGRAFTLLSSPVAPTGTDEEPDLPDLVRLERATHVHRIKTALKDRSSKALRQAMIDLMSRMERQPG